MNDSPSLQWVRQGVGHAPRSEWSFVTDAPLVGLDYAAETGHLLVADQTGGLYLFDRSGRVTTMSRGFHDLRAISLAARGTAGTAILGDSRLVFLTDALSIEWSVELSDTVTGTGIAPFGEQLFVGLANGTNYLLRSDRKRLARFVTTRPVRFVRFVNTAAEFVVAAEYGLLAKYDLAGRQQWEDKIWSNVGELAMSGDGATIALALFNHGVQKYAATGESAGRYMVEGTPHLICCNADATRFAIATLENHLYWIDWDGTMLWAATAPEAISRLAVTPVGERLIVGFKGGRLLALSWPE